MLAPTTLPPLPTSTYTPNVPYLYAYIPTRHLTTDILVPCDR